MKKFFTSIAMWTIFPVALIYTLLVNTALSLAVIVALPGIIALRLTGE